ALAKEWPETLVKAIDVDASLSPEVIAERVFEELRSGDCRVEVGYSKDTRYGVALGQLAPSKPLLLGPESVVVVTGGAKGIGAKLSLALARKYRSQLALLGRSAADAEVDGLLAQLKAEGVKASYHRADVRDAKSVKEALEAVRTQHG